MPLTDHPARRLLPLAVGLLMVLTGPLLDRGPVVATPALAQLATLPDTIIRDTLGADTIRPGDPSLPDTLVGTLRAGDPRSPILLEGVVVQILRSPIQISSAPFAVSVLGQEILQRGRSNSSIDEALQGLPGVQVQNRFNDAVGERISIRGFGARSQFGVRGIRILVDGIPATLPDGQSNLDHLDLGSLGRVEALRGPGSALYGNASGGVLDFRSQPPPESPFRQQLRTVYGDFGLRQNQSTTSGRIGSAGYLVNFSRYEWGGYRLHPDATANQTYGATLRDQVNAYTYFPLGGGEARVTLNAMDLVAENPGSLGANAIIRGDRQAFPANVLQQAGKSVRQGQLGARWVGPINGRELELSGYGLSRDMTNPNPGDYIDLDRQAAGVRAMIRTDTMSEMGPLWWAMGFETDLQLDDRRTHENHEGVRGPVLLDQSERVFGGAIFLQALLPIAPILDVLTGLRYDRIRFSADDRLGGLAGRPDGSGYQTLDSASPSFGLHAAFHRAFGAYVNLSTAFETPTTSEMSTREDGLGGFNLELEPQVGITSELGARGLVGNSTAWELTYFHTVLYNEIVPFEIDGQTDRRYFRNSGRSRRDGWEATLQFNPDPMISARFVLSTNDARFRDYEVDGVDYAGNRVPGLSPRRFEGILRIGPGLWFVEFRGETSAPIPGNDANDPEAESPGYWLSDVRVGGNDVEFAGLRFSPFAGVTNLFDAIYNTSVTANAFEGRFFEPGPGRGLYVGAAIAFQR